MASVFSALATLSCAPTNTIPKPSVANSPLNTRCPNLFGPFIVLAAESDLLVNTLRKLKPCDPSAVRFLQRNKALAICLSHVVARAYAGGDYANTPEDDDKEDNVANGGEHGKQDAYDLLLDSDSQGDCVEVEIEKTGNNSRRIRSKVAVQASLQTVWDILTDYEKLADFIPGLAVSQLLEKRDNFARLFQIGEQNLAFGLKFNAKGTIDCFENDIQTLPFGKKRDIEFKMVEGDFQFFEGKWSIEEGKRNADNIQSDPGVAQESQTTLLYIVHVKPKVWLPVRLIEGRLCKEIRTNLSCIQKEAEKAFQNMHSSVW